MSTDRSPRDLENMAAAINDAIDSQDPTGQDTIAWRVWSLNLDPDDWFRASPGTVLTSPGFTDCAIYLRHALTAMTPSSLLVQLNIPAGTRGLPLWLHIDSPGVEGIVTLKSGSQFRLDGLEGFEFNDYEPVRAISLTYLDLTEGFDVPDRLRPVQPAEDSTLQGPDPATIQIDRLVWEETDLRFAE